jgi:hypothetical protein
MLITYLLLVVYPFFIFGIDIVEDVYFNSPLKHLEEDFIGLLCIFGSWWLYWEIAFSTIWRMKKDGRETIRGK